MEGKPPQRPILRVPAMLALAQAAGLVCALLGETYDAVFAALGAVPLAVIALKYSRKK